MAAIINMVEKVDRLMTIHVLGIIAGVVIGCVVISVLIDIRDALREGKK